jgi:hypothetical protein
VTDERPVHPTYGRALGGTPRTWGGRTFRPYQIGIMANAWISDDGRIEIKDRSNYHRTYVAVVDGRVLRNAAGNPKHFHSQMNAAGFAAQALAFAAEFGPGKEPTP